MVTLVSVTSPAATSENSAVISGPDNPGPTSARQIGLTVYHWRSANAAAALLSRGLPPHSGLAHGVGGAAGVVAVCVNGDADADVADGVRLADGVAFGPHPEHSTANAVAVPATVRNGSMNLLGVIGESCQVAVDVFGSHESPPEASKNSWRRRPRS